MLGATRSFALGFWYVLLTTICLFLSGCWDRRELQERHFVIAVAIDTADEGLGSEQGRDVARVETFVQPHGSKLYRLSYQIMQFTPAASTDGTKKGKTSTYVISNTGESLFEMTRDMLGQVERPLWFEHVQAVVISEAAAKQGGLQKMMDFFRRNPEIRWLTKLVVTPGEARPLLEYKPPSGEPSGMFIANSLRLYRKNTHVPGYHTDVGDFIQATDNKRRVVIGRIELVDNVIKLGGMAFFKEEKFVGYADEYATKGGKFILGIEKSAIITVECSEHPGKIIVFELFNHDTKLTPHVEGDSIYYTLDIDMRGNLGEIQCQHDTTDRKVIHTIEDLVEEEVKRNILYSLHVHQNLKVDDVAFATKLQTQEPLVWEKVKDRWDEEVFPNTSLVVSVHVSIEDIGEHK